MVRNRKIIFIILALALSMALPLSASAYSVYEDGSLSSTYTTYYRDVVSGLSPFDNYVYWRSGQYEYSLVVGDLDYNNGKFSSDQTCKHYKFTTSSGYNSTFTYSTTNINDFSLSVGNALVYSDLGNYPCLTDRGDFYAFTSLLLMFIALCIFLVRSIFGFNLRTRR